MNQKQMVANDREEGLNKCNLCLTGTGKLLRSFAERDEQHLYLCECMNCGCEFLSPQPSDDWLASEYLSDYQKRQSSIQRPKKAWFQTLLNQLNVDLSKRSLLEIGSGEGDLVAAINEKWYQSEITAIEANEECSSYYEHLKCNLITKSVETWLEDQTKKRFDIIFMFDLLEHLREPKQILEQLVSHNLNTGGMVVATFPNVDSLSRKLLNVFWPQYKVEHLFYFSQSSVQWLARELNLKTIELSALTKTLPLDYLYAIGSRFGPLSVQNCCRWTHQHLPQGIKLIALPLKLGEWLWVAQKRESLSKGISDEASN
jgi:2-polyprenyl-3-methyl-5-hydroxy-6-metoxy-1,4-benzoquinol methylase